MIPPNEEQKIDPTDSQTPDTVSSTSASEGRLRQEERLSYPRLPRRSHPRRAALIPCSAAASNLHDDPTDSRSRSRSFATLALARRWVIVVDLHHPVLRWTVKLVRPVGQDGCVTARKTGHAGHCLNEGPPIEVLARHGRRLGEKADLLTPSLDRPLFLDIVIDVAFGSLWVRLVPDIPTAPHPRVISSLGLRDGKVDPTESLCSDTLLLVERLFVRNRDKPERNFNFGLVVTQQQLGEVVLRSLSADVRSEGVLGQEGDYRWIPAALSRSTASVVSESVLAVSPRAAVIVTTWGTAPNCLQIRQEVGVERPLVASLVRDHDTDLLPVPRRPG